MENLIISNLYTANYPSLSAGKKGVVKVYLTTPFLFFSILHFLLLVYQHDFSL